MSDVTVACYVNTHSWPGLNKRNTQIEMVEITTNNLINHAILTARVGYIYVRVKVLT